MNQYQVTQYTISKIIHEKALNKSVQTHLLVQESTWIFKLIKQVEEDCPVKGPYDNNFKYLKGTRLD